MRVRRLSLTDFRSYASLELDFPDGLTVITGDNGRGKTNVLEAIGWIAGLGSFRGASDDALVRDGADEAVIRLDATADDGRDVLVEAVIPRVGRNTVQVNRQRVRKHAELLGVVPVTVFSPDDLELVKGGPSGRRRWIDQVVGAGRPRDAALRAELERIVRQRNALLKQARGRLDDDVAMTLDVWDAKLAATGDALRAARLAVVAAVQPHLETRYRQVAHSDVDVGLRYAPSWPLEQPLGDALAASRGDDLKRAMTTVGPHRDDVVMAIDGAPSRTHASQGEQRSIALALRLASDAVVRDAIGTRPVLLLDDVFSELDPGRSAALIDALPTGQRLLTTAIAIPDGAEPAAVYVVQSDTSVVPR